MTRRKNLLVAIALAGVLAAGCSSTDDDDDVTTEDTTETTVAADGTDVTDTTIAGDTGTTAAPAPVDARGVTDETINIAVTLVDFEALAVVGVGTGEGWGDQEEIWQALIDAVNANGGVHGRQLVATYHKFNPADLGSSEAACVEITQDEENFAVLAGFVGLVIESNNCFAQNDIAQFSISPDPARAAEVP